MFFVFKIDARHLLSEQLYSKFQKIKAETETNDGYETAVIKEIQ